MAFATRVQFAWMLLPSTESLRPVGLASSSSSVMVRDGPAPTLTQGSLDVEVRLTDLLTFADGQVDVPHRRLLTASSVAVVVVAPAATVMAAGVRV